MQAALFICVTFSGCAIIGHLKILNLVVIMPNVFSITRRARDKRQLKPDDLRQETFQDMVLAYIS